VSAFSFSACISVENGQNQEDEALNFAEKQG
jgi:hypothetical protein